MSIPEMKARWLDDLTVGEQRRTGTYEVTREEIIEFAGEFDPQPFHLDDAAADASIFGGLCASGWHTCGMFMSMTVENLMKVGMAGMGSPGVDEIRWKKPVFPGDTLRVRSEITDKRESKSRRNLGLTKGRTEVLNQHDEVVMTLVTNVMVLKRNPG